MNTLRRGSKGPDVARWQAIVGVAPDGDFGDATDAATRAWQKARGLLADGVVGPATWSAALVEAGAPPIMKGLDASSVQGALPYALLGEYKFVILKAQQGNDGFDPWFERNMKGAIDHGIEPFAYCFTYPLPHLNPIEQAHLFVERVHAHPEMVGRPIFLDEEWPEVTPLRAGGKGWREWGCSGPQIADWMRANAAEVARLSGREPVLYTYDWWWSAVRDGVPSLGFHERGDVSWAAKYDLWMAWYRAGWPLPGMSPKVPEPFETWRFWQFDGNGRLLLPNGVDADFCVFNGSPEDLKRYASGGSP